MTIPASNHSQMQVCEQKHLSGGRQTPEHCSHLAGFRWMMVVGCTVAKCEGADHFQDPGRWGCYSWFVCVSAAAGSLAGELDKAGTMWGKDGQKLLCKHTWAFRGDSLW